ncbi:MAG: hypothetical protein RB191_07435 [Terriglobia bacterium]|nr:hypothetical protein [Terriglobia bacterium]
MSIMHAVVMGAALIIPLSLGQQMPPLKGEFLTGRQAELPGAASGRVALLAVGFTYNSRFPVEAWIGRFRKDYGHNSQVTFFEIPMIGGMARLGKWFIDSGMRKGTPEKDRENVITVYGDSVSWKQRLGFQSPDAAYLIMLDRHGAIRWRHNGGLDEAAYKELSDKMEELLRKAK